MGVLPHDRIGAVHRAAVSAGLDRRSLLAGVSVSFSRSIAGAASESEQIHVDLHAMNDAGRLRDGTVPLVQWLEAAVNLAAQRSEGRVFEDALREVRAALSRGAEPGYPSPNYRDEATRALGVELERERSRKRTLEAAGVSTEAVSQRILEIRRKLREGGQLREGDTLGRYTLLEMIGRGGFAVVWKAFDPEQKGLVALKVLHPNLAGDAVRRERFFRGAREMAGIEHAGIVRVLVPSEEDEGFHFFVMEHVPGGDLQHAVLNGGFARERALPIVLAVGEALAIAHGKGLVHRDVKPANILLGAGGEPRLTDFDLVGGGDTTGGTRTGAMGSFLYAAPEMMSRPQDANARADVFGLAMTAVFVLHGAPLPQTVLRHTDAFVDALPCGAAVKAVLKRALDWEPGKRFKDARELCDALRNAGPAARSSGAAVVRPAWEELPQDSFGRVATFAVGGVVQRMRWIPPGQFLMGSPATEVGRRGNEGPQHEVVLTQGYWLAETPCTQALWEPVMGENPSRFKSPDRPVENVSWEDCHAFLSKLDRLVPGLGARLPTEAEWEHACRAGTTGATWLGDLDLRGENNAPILDAIAWYGGNSGVGFELANGYDSSKWPEKQHPHTQAGTHPVGKKEPNLLGLHDMLGNVWEWCEDWYGDYAAGGVEDPHGPPTGSYRVARGGSWVDGARLVRAALRDADTPGSRLMGLGFRLARGQAPEKGRSP